MHQNFRGYSRSSRRAPEYLTIVPTSGLSAEQRCNAMSLVLKDTFFSQTMSTLTTGIFLIGLALHYGAPNLLIGLLAAIPFLAQLAQLPGIYLQEKFKVKQKITVISALVSRLLLLPMILTPLLPSKPLALTVLFIAFFLHAVVGAIGTCAWNSWLKDIIPSESLGSFFSKRLAIASLITMTLTLLGGYFLEVWTRFFPQFESGGYGVLFLIAMLSGLLGVRLLSRMPETPYCLPFTEEPLMEKLIEPLRNKNYSRLTRFLVSWNFAVNLVIPFLTIYMLTSLHFSLFSTTLLNLVPQASTFLFLGIWGKLSDRYSNKSVLMLCAPLFLFCILAWTLISITAQSFENQNFTLAMVCGLQILLGIATAGVTLANGNVSIKLAPEGKATAYLATNTMTSSIAAGVAPLIGGLCADVFKNSHVPLILSGQGLCNPFTIRCGDLNAWTLFFGLAFLLGVIALIQLRSVDEAGHVKKRVVLKQLFSDQLYQIRATRFASRRLMVRYLAGRPVREIARQK